MIPINEGFAKIAFNPELRQIAAGRRDYSWKTTKGLPIGS
jgi:hypothetical protein